MIDFALRRATNIHQEQLLGRQGGARAPQPARSRWCCGSPGFPAPASRPSRSSSSRRCTRAGRHTYMPRRRQRPPRPEPRSRLHRCRPRREHPPRRRGGQAVRRCRADRALLLHLALPGGAADGARIARARRVHRGLRRHADRGMHAARPEGALRQGAGRARSRTSPASTALTSIRRRRSCTSAPPAARRRNWRPSCWTGCGRRGLPTLRMIPLKPVAMKGLISYPLSCLLTLT